MVSCADAAGGPGAAATDPFRGAFGAMETQEAAGEAASNLTTSSQGERRLTRACIAPLPPSPATERIMMHLIGVPLLPKTVPV